jgi:hypothetical protein
MTENLGRALRTGVDGRLDVSFANAVAVADVHGLQFSRHTGRPLDASHSYLAHANDVATHSQPNLKQIGLCLMQRKVGL